jgi:hypothetical protein
MPPALLVPCSVEGCDKPAMTRGWCGKHYQRWRLYGSPVNTGVCSAEGCDKPAGKEGWCAGHLIRQRLYGDPLALGGFRKEGYVMLTIDGREIEEHRYVMEQELGRPLEDWEEVHHKNEVKHDNRPENLVLTNKWTHKKLHATFRSESEKECSRCRKVKSRDEFPRHAQPTPTTDPHGSWCKLCSNTVRAERGYGRIGSDRA